MQILKIKANLISNDIAKLNTFLGSSVRGAILERLRQKYCNLEKLDCENCQKGNECPARALLADRTEQSMISNNLIINTKILENLEQVGGVEKRHGYVYSNNIEISITLLGFAIIYAGVISEVLNDGIKIGKYADASIKGRPLFYSTLTQIEETTTDKEILSKAEKEQGTVLKVEFESPVNFNASMLDLDFKQFMRAVLIRYKAVLNLTNEQPDYDYKELTESANSKCKLISRNTRKETVRRYSTRTDKSNNIIALTGELLYKGDFSKYLGYIRLAEYLNIGSWTSMGLGNIKVTVY